MKKDTSFLNKYLSRKVVDSLVLLTIAACVLLPASKNWSFYTRKYDHEKVAKMYDQSQYVKGEDSIGIGDDALYAFSGFYYMQGGDPAAVNFEHPPLGKYLIGLSILFFGNENVIYLFFAYITLWFTHKMGSYIYSNQLGGFISMLFLAFSPLFQIQFLPSSPDQYSVSLLDLPQTMFFIAGIYFLFTNQKWKYYVSSGLWGLAFATKFFPGILLLLPLVGYQVWKNDNGHLKQWFKSLFFIPFIYLISYTMYFVYQPSFIEFIRFQKYTIAWRLGNPAVLGNIMRTIFSGRYNNWWDGGVLADPEWNWVLPIIVSLACIGGIKAIMKKEKNISFLVLLCFIYFIYVGINTVGIARYIVPVYPVLVLLVPRVFSEMIAYAAKRIR